MAINRSTNTDQILTENGVSDIITEIQDDAEVSRRAEFKKRDQIYRDGGKRFLIEQLIREFDQESIEEMRIAPVNLLKKIVDKRAALYKRPPMRAPETGLDSDAELVSYYEQALSFDDKMAKWNRYFVRDANSAGYVYPKDGKIEFRILPPYLYSVVPRQDDPTIASTWILNQFQEESRIAPFDDVPPATGRQGYSRQKGTKTINDKVASQEHESELERRKFIFWNDAQHFTVNGKGDPVPVGSQTDIENGLTDEDRDADPFTGENAANPIEKSPVINAARDRDDDFWSTEFGDVIDLIMVLMLGWTDVLTIAKHQGFSILTIISKEEPVAKTIGINKVVWLQPRDDFEPRIEYVTSNPPLESYQGNLMEVTALVLTMANLNPKEVGGANTPRNFQSGFQALIETADVLEARKMDMAPMRKAEKETWDIIARWHNWLFENDLLDEEARALGKFSDQFSISIEYPEVKPLESQEERLNQVEKQMDLNLMTRHQAMKKLNPDMSDQEIESRLQEIDEEFSNMREQARRLVSSDESDS